MAGAAIPPRADASEVRIVLAAEAVPLAAGTSVDVITASLAAVAEGKTVTVVGGREEQDEAIKAAAVMVGSST